MGVACLMLCPTECPLACCDFTSAVPVRQRVGPLWQYAIRMSQPATPASSATRPPFRSVALPTEHGGWGFTLEPIILGLLVVPSATTWELGVAALAVFLARRPFKIVATDVRRRRWLPRSTTAAVVAGVYGTIALLGVIGSIVTASAPFWVPFVVAAPFVGIALYGDAHSRSRTLTAELSGASVMGSTVAAMALAHGWDPLPAFGLWLVLVARGVAAIVLVRGQVRRVHNKPTMANRVYAGQIAAISLAIAIAVADAAPWLSVLAIAGIAVVAVVSLQRPPVRAQVIGWTQMGVGLAVVLLTALGVRLGW